MKLISAKVTNTDVIIVGTGAAGLFAALSIPEDINIVMITKDRVENSDSYLAQGGICVLKTKDDYENYFEDTMRAGRYENNKASVEVMIRSSRNIIDQLIHYGVEFERDKEGNLLYTREGAHSTYRILYHQDVTGKEITSKLIAQVRNRSNIQIKEYTTMIDLINIEGVCRGILTIDNNGNKEILIGKDTILATGGIGGLFVHSTNFPHITGDSFAIALRHQIVLENINYIQIHPTTLYTNKKERSFLISESVRGEGAYLLNEKKERFVDELQPRDVVTEAIWKEMQRFGTDYVYLTFEGSNVEKEMISYRFPNIYKKCMELGYDLSKDYIPVTPAQHYLMGGIKVDLNGKTSMKHLYAIGETACNGVHGANRLASNSLLESLVFAEKASRDLIENRNKLCELDVDYILTCIDTSNCCEKTIDELERENKEIIMKEIKRRDEEFYVKWCNAED